MNILFIGDIFASTGRSLVARYLQEIISSEKIQLAIANAENSAGGFGITPLIAEELFSMGLDVLTSGNHIWDKKEIFDYLPRKPRLVASGQLSGGPAGQRPDRDQGAQRRGGGDYRFAGPHSHAANRLSVSQSGPNSGVHLDPQVKVRFVDFHAELTSEKMAMGWYLDGRVSAMLGTHTHVPTADERILAGGTAYQTDVGMTGPYDSVIGSEKNLALRRFLTGMPIRLDSAKGGAELHATIVTVDPETGQRAQNPAL